MAKSTAPKKSALDKRKITNPVTQIRNRLIGVTVAGLALSAATFFLYASPAMKDASAASANLTTANQALAAATTNLGTDTQSLVLQAATAYSQAATLDKLLPQLGDVATAASKFELSTLPGLVAASGAKDVGSFQNPTNSQSNGALVLSSSVQISGTYAQINAFIRNVYSQPQLYTITNLNITTSPSAGNGIYIASMQLNAWYLDAVKPVTQP